jgi:NADPH:quinone reductase-like Zn-dependent oxidoreductase
VKKIIIPKAGDKSVFQIVEQNQPLPAQGEVLIDVQYSGINFADIHMRQGLYQDAPPFPFVPGYEVSGKIKALGEGVSDLEVGEPVMAGCFFGGYAGQVCVPVRQVRKLADDKDETMQMGASVLVSFLTAYLCLFETLKVRTGESLLIDCSTGSLGQMMSQLLEGMDVKITGMTSSPSKVDALKSRDVTPIVGGYESLDPAIKYNCIVNSRGGETVELANKQLKTLGRQVLVGASDMIKPKKSNLFKVVGTWWKMRSLDTIAMINQNIGFHGLNVLNIFKEEELIERYLNQIGHFNIKSTVDKIFPYHEVGEAHEYIEQRKSKGKVLLKW